MTCKDEFGNDLVSAQADPLPQPARDHPLTAALDMALLLELRERARTGIHAREEDIAWMRSQPPLAESLLYLDPGETARAFTRLVRTLVVLACAPGGVRFAGTRYECADNDRYHPTTGARHE